MPSEHFDQISVRRINIVDEHGRVRLAITDASPDFVLNGKTYPRSVSPGAGLVFYNDEGMECGGLIWNGKDGAASAKLVFDRYGQQDVFSFHYEEADGAYGYGLVGWDQPDTPLAEMVEDMFALESMSDGPEKEALRERVEPVFTQRFFVGRDGDGGSKIVLCDSAGRPRVRIEVGADDEPRIEILGPDGDVRHRIG